MNDKNSFVNYGLVFGFFAGVIMSFFIPGLDMGLGACIGLGVGYLVGKNIKKR